MEGPGTGVRKHQRPKSGRRLEGNDRVKCKSEDATLFGCSTIICAFQNVQGDMKTLEFGNNLVCLPACHRDVKIPEVIKRNSNKPNPLLWLFIIDR